MKFRFNGREHTKKYYPDDIRSCKIECACACTGILFFLPLVSAPDSRYGRFWANQGVLILMFEILSLIAWAISSSLLLFLAGIPFVGIIFKIVRVIVGIAIILVNAFYIFFPMSFAARGRAKDIPYFGFMRFINN